MTTIIIDVLPVPKPRMTQSDRWRKRPAVMQYRAFCDELRSAVGSDFELPPVFDIVFYLPCPRSWSHKKQVQMHGKPHQQTPDRDNLLKAFQDALLQSDAHIYDGRVGKYWTNGPGYIAVEWIGKE